jgi:hypothetical protein
MVQRATVPLSEQVSSTSCGRKSSVETEKSPVEVDRECLIIERLQYRFSNNAMVAQAVTAVTSVDKRASKQCGYGFVHSARISAGANDWSDSLRRSIRKPITQTCF